MSEQEQNNVIDITSKLQEKRIDEGVKDKFESGDFSQKEKSPSIITLASRKINGFVRSIMSPKR